MLYWILGGTLLGGFAGMIGGVILLWREQAARKISIYLVSLAAGALMGAAFFELLPEALEAVTGTAVQGLFFFVVLGILSLFVFEKALHWYHCHDREVCDYHSFSTSVLMGDAIHNFLDGLIIAFSFSVSVHAGIATTFAVFLHEIPQEMGDFGVLLHAGYKKSKILFYNILTALTALAGALLGYVGLSSLQAVVPFMLAFAAGTFIYIAVADLIPELRTQLQKSLLPHILLILFGVAFVWGLGVLIPE